MLTFDRITRLDVPRDVLFDFLAQPENLARISPRDVRLRIVRGPSRRLREGDEIEYAFRVFGVPLRWQARITTWIENERFADLQQRGPFKYWLHTHTLRDAEGGATEMIDHVEYELPIGFIAPLIKRKLERIFDARRDALRDLLRGHATRSDEREHA